MVAAIIRSTGATDYKFLTAFGDTADPWCKMTKLQAGEFIQKLSVHYTIF
jgi:hypothetical protein